jgi:hypothetical protein
MAGSEAIFRGPRAKEISMPVLDFTLPFGCQDDDGVPRVPD